MTTAKCPMHHLDVPFNTDFYADPYPVYARLREDARIHRVCLPEGPPVWLVTRYDDVAALLKDRRLVRNRRHANSDYESELLPEFVRAGNLHMEDGPVHARLRRFMNFAFTPKRIDMLRPTIVAETDRLLDEVEKRGGGDLMHLLAAPLPISITIEMLGIPEIWVESSMNGAMHSSAASSTTPARPVRASSSSYTDSSNASVRNRRMILCRTGSTAWTRKAGR